MTKTVTLEEAIASGNRWYLTDAGVQVSMLGAGATFSWADVSAYNPHLETALKSMQAAPKLYRRDTSLSGEYVRATVQNFVKPFTIIDAQGETVYVYRVRTMAVDHSDDLMKLSVLPQELLMLTITEGAATREWPCMVDMAQPKDVLVDKERFNEQVPGWHERYCAGEAIGLWGENIAKFVFQRESVPSVPDMNDVRFG